MRGAWHLIRKVQNAALFSRYVEVAEYKPVSEIAIVVVINNVLVMHKEDIPWLDVAVDDAKTVQFLQTFSQIPCNAPAPVNVVSGETTRKHCRVA